MHPADAQAVTRDAHEAGQAFVAGPRQRLDGASGAEGHFPLVGLDQVVQLDQVDVVDAQPLQRPLEARPGRVATPIAGLGGEEELAGVRRQPRRHPQLGIPVRCRYVQVVDACLEQDGQQRVGCLLAHRCQRRATEDYPAALVARASECGAVDHAAKAR